jgi:hypothetical protein
MKAVRDGQKISAARRQHNRQNVSTLCTRGSLSAGFWFSVNGTSLANKTIRQEEGGENNEDQNISFRRLAFP